MSGKPAIMGYIMQAFANAPQISSSSATTTRSSLFEIRSLRRWTNHRSGSRPCSARLTRRFSAARSSGSTDSLALFGNSLLQEPSIKELILRRCCKCRAIFVKPCSPLTDVFHACRCHTFLHFFLTCMLLFDCFLLLVLINIRKILLIL